MDTVAQIGNARIELRPAKGSWYGVFVNNVQWQDKVHGQEKAQALFDEVVRNLTTSQARLAIPRAVMTANGMLSREMAQWAASMVFVKAKAYAEAHELDIAHLDGQQLYDAILADAIYAALLYAALRSIGKVEDPESLKQATRPSKWVRPGGPSWERLRRKIVAYIQSTCRGIEREGSVNAYWRF